MTSEKKLFIGLLGEPNSGKTTTWNTLFNGKTKTGIHERGLKLFHLMWEDVFLINGSPEETNIPLVDRLGVLSPRILLSSLQYIDQVQASLSYIYKNYDDIFIMWLNPGFQSELIDDTNSDVGLNLMSELITKGATVCMRDGSKANINAQEIRAYIQGWAINNFKP